MWLTAGMLRPRAATSEATSIVTSFLRKLSSAAVRADWSMSPCSAIAAKPCRTSERCSAATSLLRLQKTIAFVRPSGTRMRRRRVLRFSGGSRQVLTSIWVVVATVVAGRETSIFTGLCRNWSVMCWISGRHGRREEQGLPRKGHELADALDIGNEAHVEHAVGFVDHEEFDAGEQQLAALEMVEQAARRCDEHVDAAGDLGVLFAEGNAADDAAPPSRPLIGSVLSKLLLRPGRRALASAPGSGFAASARAHGRFPAASSSAG